MAETASGAAEGAAEVVSTTTTSAASTAADTAADADPSITTGLMTVVAQATMVGAALVAARIARGRGHSGVMSLALVLVIVRGLLAAFGTSWWIVIPVQVLEGMAMGLGGVAIPALVAEIMEDTGHATAGLGGVMTAFGAGATVSPLLAGVVAQYLGFGASFIALASVAGAGLLLWIVGPKLLGTDSRSGQIGKAAANPA